MRNRRPQSQTCTSTRIPRQTDHDRCTPPTRGRNRCARTRNRTKTLRDPAPAHCDRQSVRPRWNSRHCGCRESSCRRASPPDPKHPAPHLSRGAALPAVQPSFWLAVVPCFAHESAQDRSTWLIKADSKVGVEAGVDGLEPAPPGVTVSPPRNSFRMPA